MAKCEPELGDKMAACALGAALTALLLLAGPGPAAATDDDGDDGRSCNRNGVPDEAGPGGCRCDAAWQGATCTELALLPAPAAALGTIYPGRNSTTASSWGGTVTKGADGRYHLLVSEMLAGCGLGSWQHNSVIRHATSSTIDGVFAPHEIVLGAFAHNAACMDARPGGGPACILLHIGSGTHDEAKHPIWKDCTGGFSPSSPPPAPAPFATVAAAAGPVMTPVMEKFAVGEAWTNETLTCAADAAGSTACTFDNPSGWVDADGTAWINYVQRGKHGESHNITGRGGYGFGLAKAPRWQGPYTPVARPGLKAYWDAPVLPSAGTPLQNCEDSVIYRDSRGDFHMLFHYFGLAPDHGDHGGHAHASASGDDWEFTVGHAWNLTVPFDDTTEAAAQYGYRQRPHIVMNDGELTHLITGVVFDSTRPYPAPACSKCTGTHGPCDRSWTTMQPIRSKDPAA